MHNRANNDKSIYTAFIDTMEYTVKYDGRPQNGENKLTMPLKFVEMVKFYVY